MVLADFFSKALKVTLLVFIAIQLVITGLLVWGIGYTLIDVIFGNRPGGFDTSHVRLLILSSLSTTILCWSVIMAGINKIDICKISLLLSSALCSGMLVAINSSDFQYLLYLVIVFVLPQVLFLLIRRKKRQITK